MKSTIIVSLGKECEDLFHYLGCLLSVDSRPLSKIIAGLSVVSDEFKSTKGSESSLLKERVFVDGEKYDFSSLFKDSIQNQLNLINSEEIRVKVAKYLKMFSGTNFIFVGLLHNKIFSAFLKNDEYLKLLGMETGNNIYIVSVITKESFKKGNLSVSIDAASYLNKMSFPGLAKKVIMTDVNEDQNSVSFNDVLANTSTFIFSSFLNSNIGEQIMNALKTNPISYTSGISVNFVSIGTAISFMPINILRCELSNDYAKKFVRWYFGNKLDFSGEVEYKNAKKSLADFTSYDYFFNELRTYLIKLMKKEDLFLGKIGELKRIPIKSLVEALVNYQVLLINSDLHSIEDASNKWLKNNRILDLFSKKIKEFENKAISNSPVGFISILKNLKLLLNDIANELNKSASLEIKGAKKVYTGKEVVFKNYREQLSTAIKNFPKPLPYYTKFVTFSIFLAYIGFLVSKIILKGSFKNLFFPWFIAVILFSISLFFAWFALWKKKQLIYFLAESWREQIENGYLINLDNVSNDTIKSILKQEMETVKQEIDKYEKKIELVKQFVVDKVSNLNCPSCNYTLRFNELGKDYYRSSIFEKLRDENKLLKQILDESKALRDSSLFDKNESLISDTLIKEIKKSAFSIIVGNDLDVNLSTYIHQKLSVETKIDTNDTNKSVVTIINDILVKSKVLISTSISFQPLNENIIEERYLFLPQDLPANDIELILKKFKPNLFNKIYKYDNNYAISIIKLRYNFPIGAIGYFNDLFYRVSKGNKTINKDVYKYLKDLFGKDPFERRD